MLTKEQCNLLYKQSVINSEFSNDVWEEVTEGKANKVGDEFWYIETVSEVSKDKIWNWNECLKRYELPSQLLEVVQEICLAYMGGYSNPNNGRIVLSSETLYERSLVILRLYSLMYAREKDAKKWIFFTTEQIKEFVWEQIDVYRNAADTVEKNTGSSIADNFWRVLKWIRRNQSYSLFSEEALIPLFNREAYSNDWLQKNSLTYDEFWSSTHHKTIPHHISMKWIAWIIEQFDESNEEFIFHSKFTNDLREKFSLLLKQNNMSRIEDMLDAMVKHGITGKEEKENRYKHVKRANLILKSAKKCFKKDLSIKEVSALFKRYSEKSTGISFVSKTTNYLSHVYAAIILANGARKSEVNTLCLADFKKITDEHSEYTTLIHKTMNGLSTVRSISGYVYDLVMSVRYLNGVDRLEDGVSFWLSKPPRKSDNYHEQGGFLFARSYQIFLDSISKEDSEFIRGELPFVSPHMGRHTFFGICLRFGDQNAYEKINEHARHEMMSYMTQQYTEGKLDEMQRLSIEKEFIAELVCNLVEEKDLGYFGPQVSVLQKLVKEHIDFYDLDNPKDIEAMGNAIADGFDRLKVNETGLCMPRKDTLDQSKCWNGKFPDYEEGSLFVNCSACIHNFCQRGHKEAIERHMISVSDMLDNAPLLGGKLRKKYENELLQGEKLLAMADKQND